MKKFKKIKPFKGSTLTKEQMNLAKGGLLIKAPIGCTCGTYSVCHIDGTDDSDGFHL